MTGQDPDDFSIGTDSIRDLDSTLRAAKMVAVVSHNHPDGDAIGSCIAMASFIEAIVWKGDTGREVKAILPDPVDGSLEFMLEWGTRPLIHSEDKEGTEAYMAASDTVICVDINAFSRTGDMEAAIAASRAGKVLIDHHLFPDAGRFSIVFSTPEVSSTCELLFKIFMAMPEINGMADRLPKATANALMTGIITDTNNFMNSVFPGTLKAVSALLASGVDRNGIIRHIYFGYSERRLRAMGYFLYEKLKISPEGVAYVVFYKEDLERLGLSDGDTEGFVNLPLAAREVRLSIFLKEEGDRFRVSIRSKEGTSARACATDYFHGGGHEMAAGGKLFVPDDIAERHMAEAYITESTSKFLG